MGSLTTTMTAGAGRLHVWGFTESLLGRGQNFVFKPVHVPVKECLVDVACGHSHVVVLSGTSRSRRAPPPACDTTLEHPATSGPGARRRSTRSATASPGEAPACPLETPSPAAADPGRCRTKLVPQVIMEGKDIAVVAAGRDHSAALSSRRWRSWIGAAAPLTRTHRVGHPVDVGMRRERPAGAQRAGERRHAEDRGSDPRQRRRAGVVWRPTHGRHYR